MKIHVNLKYVIEPENCEELQKFKIEHFDSQTKMINYTKLK